MWFLRQVRLTIAVATTGLIVLFPILLLWEYVSPWQEAIDVMREKNPGQFWIPVGGGSSTSIDGSTTTREHRWRELLLLPANKTVILRQDFRRPIEYEEHDGGLASLLGGLGFLIGAWLCFGLPEIRSRWRKWAQEKHST